MLVVIIDLDRLLLILFVTTGAIFSVCILYELRLYISSRNKLTQDLSLWTLSSMISIFYLVQ